MNSKPLALPKIHSLQHPGACWWTPVSPRKTVGVLFARLLVAPSHTPFASFHFDENDASIPVYRN